MQYLIGLIVTLAGAVWFLLKKNDIANSLLANLKTEQSLLPLDKDINNNNNLIQDNQRQINNLPKPDVKLSEQDLLDFLNGNKK